MLVEIEVACPVCGEPNPIAVDTAQGDFTTIEDCTVCCRPMQLIVVCELGNVSSVEAAAA